MSTRIRNRAMILVAAMVLLSPSVPAQDLPSEASARNKTHTRQVLATASGKLIRFTSLGELIEIRLEVIGPSGEVLFDSGFKPANVIDWPVIDHQGQPIADGAYLCVVTVKDSSGQVTRKVALASLQGQSVSLRQVDLSLMSAAQAGAADQVPGEDKSMTILDGGGSVSGAVLAHDGAAAHLVSGSGGLTISSGDFFAKKTIDLMRLTAEGNLGIGITSPQARLDVAGRIRASEGIIFPDGSIQFSAARKTLGAASLRPGQSAKPGQEHFEAQSVTATQNFLAKFSDNAGTLTNSLIFDNGTNVGIGTTTPQYGLDYRGNNSAAAFTRDLGTTPVPVPQSVLQLGISNVASRSIGIGPSFLFFGDNTAGAKSFLGRVSAVWENPTAGAEAGSILFQVRANSSDTTASTERMRITASGNVGIGTSTPAARLDVAGNINTSTQYNIGGQRVLSVAGFNNVFAGVNAGHRNTTGSPNSFFGDQAGYFNTTGNYNSFFGFGAGYRNNTECCNTFIGAYAYGQYGTTNATAIGYQAQVTQSNSLVLGSIKDINYATADTNVGIGITAPSARLSVVTSSTNSGDNTANFSAPNIGANASHIHWGTTGDWYIRSASSSGRVILQDSGGKVGIGTTAPADLLHVNGIIRVDALGAGSFVPLCRNASNQISTCSSSLRYKTDLRSFTAGVDLINRLRPVSFTWRAGGQRDVGLVAEEVEKIEPLLVTYNASGEVEGVKYDRINVALVNAMKQQQQQIILLQQQNTALGARLKALERRIQPKGAKSANRRSAKASTSNSARR